MGPSSSPSRGSSTIAGRRAALKWIDLARLGAGAIGSVEEELRALLLVTEPAEGPGVPRRVVEFR